jgi:glycosyltransferase involved in cell wall biosynthesis
LGIVRLPIFDASSRQRVYQYREILKNEYGIILDVIPLYPNFVFNMRNKISNIFIDVLTLIVVILRLALVFIKSFKYKIIWILRDPSPFDMIHLLKIFKIYHKKIIYDFDDAIYINNIRINNYIKMSDMVFAGNENLVKYAKQFCENVVYIPTTLDTSRFLIKEDYGLKDGYIKIGWIGSLSTIKYLEGIKDVFEKLGERYSIKLIILGAKLKKELRNCSVEYVPWSLGIEEKVTKEFDIAVAPLVDDEWTRGKCGFKIIEYMAAGVPVIASSIGVQEKIVIDSFNGYLAKKDDEWFRKLEKLINSCELREFLGRNGREFVKKNYDITIWAKEIANIIYRLYNN